MRTLNKTNIFFEKLYLFFKVLKKIYLVDTPIAPVVICKGIKVMKVEYQYSSSSYYSVQYEKNA